MHPWMAIDTPLDGVAASLDASRDGDRCNPGWRSMHPGMVIMHPRMVTIASRDGDLEMAIDASRDGDRCIPGLRLMHPGMVIIASRDG